MRNNSVGGDFTASSVVSVADFVRDAKRLLEASFRSFWLGGEVVDFHRAARSGNWYFSLREGETRVDCVFFAEDHARYAENPPAEGDSIEVFARPTVFAPRGRLQIVVRNFRAAGAGDRFRRHLELKKRLAALGWFADSRKRPLPPYARVVAVVASLAGAAIRDAARARDSRNPAVSLVVYPAPAQGADAPAKIAAAIRAAGARAASDGCEAIVVCRGGGDWDDLAAYNSEEVARAIVESPLPVVTGVGHESDETIADLAADVRAPTPTAAAAAAVFSRERAVADLRALAARARRGVDSKLLESAERIDFAARRARPRGGLLAPRLRLCNVADRLRLVARARIDADGANLARQKNRLAAGAGARRESADLRAAAARGRLRFAARAALRGCEARLRGAAAVVAAMNPQNILARGFAVARDKEGRVVRDAKTLTPGDEIDLRFAVGEATADIRKIK